MIQLPRLTDPRGSLTFIEGGTHIPFAIERIYYLYDLPSGSARGSHGHRALEQVVVAVAGGFEVVLDDGRERQRVRLDDPGQGLYIAPMIWRDIEGFRSGSVCLVLASARYDEADYFRNYDDFVRAARGDRLPTAAERAESSG